MSTLENFLQCSHKFFLASGPLFYFDTLGIALWSIVWMWSLSILCLLSPTRSSLFSGRSWLRQRDLKSTQSVGCCLLSLFFCKYLRSISLLSHFLGRVKCFLQGTGPLHFPGDLLGRLVLCTSSRRKILWRCYFAKLEKKIETVLHVFPLDSCI